MKIDDITRYSITTIKDKVEKKIKLSPETANKIDSVVTSIPYKKQIGSYKDIPINITPVWFALVIFISYGFTTSTRAEQIQTLFISQAPFIEFNFVALSPIAQFVFGMITICSVYASVLLHEFGHAIKAYDNNLQVEEIALWVLGGVAKIQITNVSSRVEIEVAAAGPIVSIFISAISGVLAVTSSVFPLPSVITLYLIIVATTNVAILLFNILPVFPFDGGRLLRATLKYKMNHVTATKYATRLTQLGAVVFVAYGIFSVNLLFVLLGMFVVYTAKKELNQSINQIKHNSHKEIIENIPEETDETIEFVDKSDGDIPTSLPLFLQSNVHMATSISHDTDYIITTESKQQMYNSIAKTYDAEILLVSYLPEVTIK